MHRALWIDEVLRKVFNQCYYDPHEDLKISRRTLAQAARCCSTWKEPALDQLWRRLTCVQPVLDLLPSGSRGSKKSDENALRRLASYAQRVRYIACRCHVDPTQVEMMQRDAFLYQPLFLNLADLDLSNATMVSLRPLLRSPRIQRLRVDLGFRSPQNESNCNCVIAYLQDTAALQSSSPNEQRLQILSLRGTISYRLSDGLLCCTALQSVSLLCGSTLSPALFLSLGRMPYLRALEVHASELGEETLSTRTHDDEQFFPSLTTFRIRTSAHFARALFPQLTTTTLSSIHVEAAQATHTHTLNDWHSALNALTSIPCITTSLIDFRLEHQIELDDVEGDDNLSTSNLDSATAISPNFGTVNLDQHTPVLKSTIDVLRPLSALKALRGVSLDLFPKPDFTDRQIEEFGKWWPSLEHFSGAANLVPQ